MIPKDIFKKESFSFQFQIRIKGLNDQVLYLGNTDRDIQNGTFASSCKKIKNSTYIKQCTLNGKSTVAYSHGKKDTDPYSISPNEMRSL